MEKMTDIYDVAGGKTINDDHQKILIITSNTL
jgi:hypothetical protein